MFVTVHPLRRVNAARCQWRKLHHGDMALVSWVYPLRTSAFHLIRIPKLMETAPSARRTAFDSSVEEGAGDDKSVLDLSE